MTKSTRTRQTMCISLYSKLILITLLKMHIQIALQVKNCVGVCVGFITA